MQQLVYRGARYSVRNQAVKTVETQLEGQFRGARYRINASQENTVERMPQRLSYRLVRYTA